MNMKIIGAVAVAAIGLGGTAGADAQFSGLGNSIKNEAKKQKKKAILVFHQTQKGEH